MSGAHTVVPSGATTITWARVCCSQSHSVSTVRERAGAPAAGALICIALLTAFSPASQSAVTCGCKRLGTYSSAPSTAR